MFGSPETTTGGKALKFYASMRFDVRRVDQIKDGTEIIGNRTRVKIVKNKLAPPFKQAEFDIMYGEGISQPGCVLDLAVEQEIIQKSGAWFSYNGEKIGQGKENAKKFLEDNEDIINELEKKIKEMGVDNDMSMDEITADDGLGDDDSFDISVYGLGDD